MPLAVGLDSEDANSAANNGGSITLYLGHLPEETCRALERTFLDKFFTSIKYDFTDRDCGFLPWIRSFFYGKVNIKSVFIHGVSCYQT